MEGDSARTRRSRHSAQGSPLNQSEEACSRPSVSAKIGDVQQKDESDPILDGIMLGTRALVGAAARSLAEVSDDVSLVQYRVLSLIDARGAQTMGELAESLGVSPSTVTRLCDLLVNKRLIRRGPTEDNRRTVCAELTPGGRRLVGQVMSRREALIAEALGNMTPEGRRRLARGLSEFAGAAGELSKHAWTLGWSMEENDSDDA